MRKKTFLTLVTTVLALLVYSGNTAPLDLTEEMQSLTNDLKGSAALANFEALKFENESRDPPFPVVTRGKVIEELEELEENLAEVAVVLDNRINGLDWSNNSNEQDISQTLDPEPEITTNSPDYSMKDNAGTNQTLKVDYAEPGARSKLQSGNSNFEPTGSMPEATQRTLTEYLDPFRQLLVIPEKPIDHGKSLEIQHSVLKHSSQSNLPSKSNTPESPHPQPAPVMQTPLMTSSPGSTPTIHFVKPDFSPYLMPKLPPDIVRYKEMPKSLLEILAIDVPKPKSRSRSVKKDLGKVHYISQNSGEFQQPSVSQAIPSYSSRKSFEPYMDFVIIDSSPLRMPNEEVLTKSPFQSKPTNQVQELKIREILPHHFPQNESAVEPTTEKTNALINAGKAYGKAKPFYFLSGPFMIRNNVIHPPGEKKVDGPSSSMYVLQAVNEVGNTDWITSPLYKVCITVIKLTTASQTFITRPADVVAKPGSSVTLECVIDDIGGTCLWRKGGKVKAVQGFDASDGSRNYEWRANGAGDCSLKITRAAVEDEGTWACEVSQSGGSADDSLRDELFLSVREGCTVEKPCTAGPIDHTSESPTNGSIPAKATGRLKRLPLINRRPTRNPRHPFSALFGYKYWKKKRHPVQAPAEPFGHPMFEGLTHKHYHHNHDFFGHYFK